MKLALTIYGLSPTHSATPPKHSEGFVLTIYGLSPTHSAMPPKCSEGFDICNYGLTTTQQQAHNRTPAGFLNKFQTQEIIQTSTRLTLRLVRSWYNSWAKV